MYLRVVGETPQGIIVRGAKAHTTAAPYVDELIIVPTRNMKAEDRDYALSFAIPVRTKGVKLICKTAPEALVHLEGARRRLDFPGPPLRLHIETLTVFDDVLVPWERVFLLRDWQAAGPLAYTCATLHRFTAVAYKPPLGELLAGAAQAIAEYNGVASASHIRDKIVQVLAYTETIKALGRAAARECQMHGGIAVPSPVITNMAKYYFADNYHRIAKAVQEVAGGLIVTAPGYCDFQNPETRPYLEKYLKGNADYPAEERMRMFQLIRFLTASDFGGLSEVLAVHAEGSIEAQKMMIYQEAPLAEYRRLAQLAAGIISEQAAAAD